MPLPAWFGVDDSSSGSESSRVAAPAVEQGRYHGPRKVDNNEYRNQLRAQMEAKRLQQQKVRDAERQGLVQLTEADKEAMNRDAERARQIVEKKRLQLKEGLDAQIEYRERRKAEERQRKRAEGAQVVDSLTLWKKEQEEQQQRIRDETQRLASIKFQEILALEAAKEEQRRQKYELEKREMDAYSTFLEKQFSSHDSKSTQEGHVIATSDNINKRPSAIFFNDEKVKSPREKALSARRRHNEQLSFKQTLQQQMYEKERRRASRKKEEMAYVHNVAEKVSAAERAEQQKKAAERAKNMEYRRYLEDQIASHNKCKRSTPTPVIHNSSYQSSTRPW